MIRLRIHIKPEVSDTQLSRQIQIIILTTYTQDDIENGFVVLKLGNKRNYYILAPGSTMRLIRGFISTRRKNEEVRNRIHC